jgi:hypothetical protein
MHGESPEIAYYRRVEDLFSSLRGTPHILSPRDFQLLRSWWRDEIPFAAVSAGLTEVFARNRDREDASPVVSLSYCRHAVKSHAKRLANMHVGGDRGDADPSALKDAVDSLLASLASAARTHTTNRPAVAAVLERIGDQLKTAGSDLSAGLLDEQLYGLESAMLVACWDAIETAERASIDQRVTGTAASSASNEKARRRSERALRDRELRLLLDLPRLELGG